MFDFGEPTNVRELYGGENEATLLLYGEEEERAYAAGKAHAAKSRLDGPLGYTILEDSNVRSEFYSVRGFGTGPSFEEFFIRPGDLSVKECKTLMLRFLNVTDIKIEYNARRDPLYGMAGGWERRAVQALAAYAHVLAREFDDVGATDEEREVLWQRFIYDMAGKVAFYSHILESFRDHNVKEWMHDQNCKFHQAIEMDRLWAEVEMMGDYDPPTAEEIAESEAESRRYWENLAKEKEKSLMEANLAAATTTAIAAVEEAVKGGDAYINGSYAVNIMRDGGVEEIEIREISGSSEDSPREVEDEVVRDLPKPNALTEDSFPVSVAEIVRIGSYSQIYFEDIDDDTTLVVDSFEAYDQLRTMGKSSMLRGDPANYMSVVHYVTSSLDVCHLDRLGRDVARLYYLDVNWMDDPYHICVEPDKPIDGVVEWYVRGNRGFGSERPDADDACLCAGYLSYGVVGGVPEVVGLRRWMAKRGILFDKDRIRVACSPGVFREGLYLMGRNSKVSLKAVVIYGCQMFSDGFTLRRVS